MLKAEGISKSYPGREALSRVSFQLAPGECLGVVGHNGSGKSTLLSIGAGVQRPTAGSITWKGQPIWGNRTLLRREFGYVPQENALVEDVSVGDNIRLWQAALEISRIPSLGGTPLLELLGLEELLRQPVKKLSGGMKKRLSIAIGLLNNPRILLLDEAYAALDMVYSYRLTQLFSLLKEEGRALLFCTHQPGEVLALCDKLLVLRQGKAVFYGSKEEALGQNPSLEDFLLERF